jgi:membrane protein DedA with SNARE-associated domain
MGFDFLVSFKDQVLTLARDHQEWIPPLVFVLGFAESIALVSLFVPSTLLFLGIGAIHHTNGGAFVPVWLAGAAGACVGDIVSYGIGYYFKDSINTVWPFRKYPSLIGKAKQMDEKWGALALIGSKFLGMLRPFAPVMAGTISMPRPRFLLASAVGALLWAGVFLSPGYGLSFFRS